MTTYCLTLLRCAILLSVHTGLTWEQQGVPCLHATYLNTEDILPLDASRSSLLRTQTCGYPLAEHKNLPMMWSLHHLNNEPDLNIGLCMTSSKKIGQVPRVDHHEFLPLLASDSRLMVIENNVFVSEGEIDSSEKVKHTFMTEKVNDTISVELQAGSNVLKVRDGPTTFDHQPIVILEDDPVVMESASFLFNKQPSVSTLLRYHKGVLQVIMGSKTHLTKNSRVVLVGHGSKGSNGVARLGGYGPDKLAKVLAAMEIEDGRLHSLNLVGCALGKDLQFAEQLLQALRSHNVDTELHLSTSELSVSPSGEILTREEGVWRQQDSSKIVIAQLDQNGIIMSRVEGSNRGQCPWRGVPCFRYLWNINI
ncbi:hypothetical protein DPEC_G00349040 [Dallia pectoralis]|uniref:Uncharacterized protein n=1 Tax=Dallia pectoralis TaxID=75939 RepID=A0ACC2F1J5_DALPE|nr:hypothetical protein DPEC_G00349040 [Dallia pectoralis]